MPVLPVAKLVSAGMAASMALGSGHAGSPVGPRFELSVRVTDRTGQLVKPIDLQLQNIATGNNVDLGQGTKRSVRPGRYNVAAWIGTGRGSAQTFTLADRIIDVTRNRTITLDARQGRLVRFRLSVPGAVEELIELAPVIHGNWAFNPGPVAVTDSVHSVYVVPVAASGVTFYAYSLWERRGNTVAHPSPYRYDIVDVHRGGIPARPSFTVSRSHLARISITVRATDQNQQATLELQPMSAAGQILPLNAGTTLGATPAHLVAYRSPGFQWQPLVDLQSPAGEIRDFVLNMTPYGPGHFTERYFAAVLSPQEFSAFADVMNRRMQVGISDFLLGDPLHPGDTDQGSGLTTLSRLFSGSRLLGKSAGGNINVRIPLATRWYTLRVDAVRQPTATLSTQIHAIWHFPAHGTVDNLSFSGRLYTAQLLPGGLNAANTARSGVITPVALRVYGIDTATPLHLHIVRAQESTNDGKTWRQVAVAVRGNHYLLNARNPKAAGFVSLRVFVKDSSGVSEMLTVLHAYGVR